MVRFFKIFNKANPKVKTKVDTSKHIINYGKDNDFPNVLIDTIDDSPTGQACISTLIDFIEGDGLSDETLSATIVNKKGETWADMHSTVSSDVGTFEGFFLLIQYSPEYKITEVYNLPFEACRLGCSDDRTKKPTHVVYNRFFGTCDYRQSEDVIYPFYDPRPEVLSKQFAEVDDKGLTTFKGQIYYKYIKRPGKHDYPIPEYNAGIEWFEADALIGDFHKNNISKNFFSSFLLKMIGDPNAKGADGNKTNSELLADDLKANLKGAENAGDAWVVWAKNKDAFPELQAFPAATNHDLFIALENIIIDRIARVTKVPPILANIQVSGKLGNTQEIVNSILLMGIRVRKRQNFIERHLQVLLPFWHEPLNAEVKTKTLNPLNHIPDNLLEALTLQEKRKLIETYTGQELEVVEDGEPNNQE
jgi:hypothetical protein